MNSKIIVIGGGFGGLAAANRLAAAGHDVHIFDKRDKLGGRGYQYDINGFKFDGGPTVITAPYIFDDIFSAAGRNRSDYFDLIPLDPFYRLFDERGHYIDYYHGIPDMLAEIDKWNPGDRSGYEKLLNRTQQIFEALHPYTDKPFLRVREMLKIIPDVVRLGGYLGTHLYVSRYIRDPFLRRALSFHPLLIGGNPFDTPSLYSLIVQFERQWGVYYARGGTGAIVSALGSLFTELGGHVHLNSEVSKILVRDRRVTGILLDDGTQIDADAVVCNGDTAYTYKHLIDGAHRRKYTDSRLARYRYSVSLMVIYFGTDKRYLDSKLRHHNIIFGPNYKHLLKKLFEGKGLPDELSLYLHMPTITDESIAPSGCESFYVLALVPNLKADINWGSIRESYKNKILSFLQDNYLPDLKNHIIAEHMIDPPHFVNTLNSYLGAAFAFKPTLLQSAYFRPHNRSEEFDNLYFVGAGTHPGAGVPAVLSSGKIAADLILSGQ
jgi:phytoene desaturase